MKIGTVLLICFLLAVPALAVSKKAGFAGTPDEVFDAVVKAAQAHWTVKFECSAVLAPIGEGRVEVTLTTHKKAQLFAWDVGKRIADKFFAAVSEQLASRSSPSTPKSQ